MDYSWSIVISRAAFAIEQGGSQCPTGVWATRTPYGFSTTNVSSTYLIYRRGRSVSKASVSNFFFAASASRPVHLSSRQTVVRSVSISLTDLLWSSLHYHLLGQIIIHRVSDPFQCHVFRDIREQRSNIKRSPHSFRFWFEFLDVWERQRSFYCCCRLLVGTDAEDESKPSDWTQNEWWFRLMFHRFSRTSNSSFRFHSTQQS